MSCSITSHKETVLLDVGRDTVYQDACAKSGNYHGAGEWQDALPATPQSAHPVYERARVYQQYPQADKHHGQPQAERVRPGSDPIYEAYQTRAHGRTPLHPSPELAL